MIRTKILTHVETPQLAAIRVESGVVEIGELLRDSVEVGHDDHGQTEVNEEEAVKLTAENG